MAFVTYLLCLVFIQLTTGQFTSFYGQGINSQNSQFANSHARPPKALTVPNLSINLATGNIAKANSANTIVTTNNIPKLNSNPNLGTSNTARNVAITNTAAAGIGVNNIAKSNINFANSGVPGSPLSIANPTLPGNIVTSIGSSQYRSSNSYNSPVQNYNPLARTNLSKLIYSNNKITNGNIAYRKRASQPNGYPNMAISNSNSQSVLSGLPGNQKYGIHIEADALEMAGNIAVTGNMPIHGAVSLNGRLPIGGVANVNYAS